MLFGLAPVKAGPMPAFKYLAKAETVLSNTPRLLSIGHSNGKLPWNILSYFIIIYRFFDHD